MAILDTMLFQRLRKITQLGLANLVYPSLNYNRFEHTIGTLGRLNQVLTRIKENDTRIREKGKKRVGISPIIDKYEVAIRLAALFHDVGHCLFSHLSEFAIDDLQGNEQHNTKENYYPSVKTIKEIFNNKDNGFSKGQENLKIFEIFSISILGTEQIAKLILNSVRATKNKKIDQYNTLEKIKDLLRQSAHFIGGLPLENEPETLFLAQLMSSGLDVDKLDYMSREELFSGIKIEMDLQRILNKINIFEKLLIELPQPLKKYMAFMDFDKEDAQSYFVLGIDKGGQFAYEEFCVARLSLYEKIYLHKKVRAAESFMKKQIKTFIGLEKNYNQAHKWLYLHESIIEIPSEYTKIVGLQENLFGKPTEIITQKVKPNLYFLDIFKRQIPDRAFGFGPSNSKTDIPINEEKVNYKKLEELQSVQLWNFLRGEDIRNDPDKDKKETQRIKKLEEDIINEAKNIIKYISENKIEFDKNKFTIPESNKDSEYWERIKNTLVVDVPNYNRVKLNPLTLHFEDVGALDTAKWTIPIDNIHNSYLLHKILAYIYVNHRFVPLITLACEIVFYKYTLLKDKKEQFVFDQTQAISKENQGIIRDIKDRLGSVGFYQDYPKLKPLHKDVTMATGNELIEEIVRDLSYLECCTPPSRLDIEEFLKQFDGELQLPVLHLISNIKVISPQRQEYLPDKIKEIRNNERMKDKKVAVLTLGGYLNSSSNFYFHLENTFKEQNIHSLIGSDGNIKTDIDDYEHILLMDDNINSGIQCFNIMMRYLGYTKNDIEENNRTQLWLDFDSKAECPILSSEISQKLRNKKFEFIFVTGHEESAERLKNYLIKYCNLKKINFNIHIINEIKNDDKLFDLGNYNYSGTMFGKLKKNFRSSVTPERIQKVADKFSEIGKQLVKEKGVCKECKQNEKDHSLGYHNRENLVIFVNSIPTMTLTALWCSGIYTDGNGDSKEWKPLIKRKL
jgi:HD superfamily phosphohydrolase